MNYIYKNLKKNIAFTLAEVLITLAIIGIVAEMTIPTLLQNVDTVSMKSGWKKNYSSLSTIGKQLAYENGGLLVNVFQTQDDLMNAFRGKYKYTKSCLSGSTLSSGCWHADNTWYSIAGVQMAGSGAGFANNSSIVLLDGTILSSSLNSSSCTSTVVPNKNGCGIVYVDVNGYKKPNTVGKDIFVARLLSDGTVIPAGTPGDANYSSASYCNTTNGKDGWDCSAYYLLNN